LDLTWAGAVRQWRGVAVVVGKSPVVRKIVIVVFRR
jgi:hypothetical protein